MDGETRQSKGVSEARRKRREKKLSHTHTDMHAHIQTRADLEELC